MMFLAIAIIARLTDTLWLLVRSERFRLDVQLLKPLEYLDSVSEEIRKNKIYNNKKLQQQHNSESYEVC